MYKSVRVFPFVSLLTRQFSQWLARCFLAWCFRAVDCDLLITYLLFRSALLKLNHFRVLLICFYRNSYFLGYSYWVERASSVVGGSCRTHPSRQKRWRWGPLDLAKFLNQARGLALLLLLLLKHVFDVYLEYCLVRQEIVDCALLRTCFFWNVNLSDDAEGFRIFENWAVGADRGRTSKVSLGLNIQIETIFFNERAGVVRKVSALP